MKKRLLSICCIALASITLASCGGENISYIEIHPDILTDKGNSVDNIRIYYKKSDQEYEYKLNNTMTFSDVILELDKEFFYNYINLKSNLSPYPEDNSFSYSNKMTSDYSAENDYEFIDSIGFVLKDKELIKSETYNSTEDYIKRTTPSSEGISSKFRAYQSNLAYQMNDISISNQKVKNVTKTETKSAKEYSSTFGNVVDTNMKYAYSSEIKMNMDGNSKKDNGTANTSLSKSFYIEDSKKSTNKDYGKTFKSYDKENEEVISYTIGYEYGINFNQFDSSFSIKLQSIYNSNLADLYNTSYELTDNYVILKFDCNFTQEIYDKADSNAFDKYKTPSVSQIKDEIKILTDGEYKNSKSSYELWLKYNYSSIKLAYYKADVITNYNLTKTYEESDFTSQEGYDSSAKYLYDYKDLIGKKCIKKSKTTKQIIFSIADNGFEDKISNLLSSCEKNNEYKDLKFIAVD